jgi:hypothetical protein
MAVSAPERRFLLSQTSLLAERDLNSLWAQADKLSDAEFAAFLVSAYPTIADPYITMAATQAAAWFELSAPESTYVAELAPLPAPEKLQINARWALSTDEARVNLSGSLQRAVFDGARETTMLNVEKTNSRWAVVARAAACPWCRMMATRGAVFKSGATALASCHDNGHCIAQEIRQGQDFEPPAYMDSWGDEYEKARANAGSGDPKAIQAAWRQILK